MTGFVFGVAMLVSSTGVSPGTQTPRISLAPAASTFDLSDSEQSRWLSRPAPFRRSQATTARRHTTTDRIIAVAAGGTVGFLVGGIIGGKITDRSKENPDDDVSVLKGVMIGAPIGAAVGAIIGWRATRN